MKAEIDSKGILILIAETTEESIRLVNWTLDNKGRIYMPQEVAALALTEFKKLSIAITRETQ